MTYKTKRSKATDIPPDVKQKVWIRDKKSCVVCGNTINVMPNAHYISRAKGGLGIEENIVTLCTELTPRKCHKRYDNGTKEEKEIIGEIIKNYLKKHYKGWNEEKLIYKKWNDYK